MSHVKPENVWGDSCKYVKINEFLYGMYHKSGKYELLYTVGSWSDDYELFKVDENNKVYEWITTEHGWNKRIRTYDETGKEYVTYQGKKFGIPSENRPDFTDNPSVMDWVNSEMRNGNMK